MRKETTFFANYRNFILIWFSRKEYLNIRRREKILRYSLENIADNHFIYFQIITHESLDKICRCRYAVIFCIILCDD